ncbi:MAG: O-antigen ligase family protein [Kiritimatiellae bacterium]|nr:O-antigen ligase family protein [Kiritimatiellia bacterium]
MKYVVFFAALAGVPALAWLLAMDRRCIRWAFFGMVAGLCFDNQTSVNFLSNEMYKGSARGMEVSLVHLLALAVLLALGLRGKWQRLLPEGGIRIYAVYFLMCLPSLYNADSMLIGWLEVWKMLLLFLVWHAVYGYLAATGDVNTAVIALVLMAVGNFASVVWQHFRGIYPPSGVFPHQNTMAMAMNLMGPMFLAGYLQSGLRRRMGRLCGLALVGTAISGAWSYSRGAIAMMPLGYGLAVVGSWLGIRHELDRRRFLVRLSPVLVVGAAGLCMMWPNLVERFSTTSTTKGSKETRVALAYCAREMIHDHPWIGVGINNWSLNMSPEHPYQDRAAAKLEREMNYDGIVETVYLLVGAECGIPALLAMLVWFGWHGVACLRVARRLAGTVWYFVPIGLLGGFAANYMQSVLEWVLRQRMNMVLLVFLFALIAYFNKTTCKFPKHSRAS